MTFQNPNNNQFRILSEYSEVGLIWIQNWILCKRSQMAVSRGFELFEYQTIKNYKKIFLQDFKNFLYFFSSK